MRWQIVGFVVLLAGCSPDEGVIPMLDAGPRRDASVRVDAGQPTDASVELDAQTEEDASIDEDADTEPDAAIHDAGTDAEPTDGGPPRPVIDGVAGDAEWADATVVTNTEATIWAGNELRRLRALLTPEGLYLAVEGVIEAGNGMIVYVDRARGTSEGVLLSDLTDANDALDNAITPGSVDPITTPSDVRVDLAWGSLDLSRSAVGADARMGWRDFVRASAPSDLFWILADEAPTTCGADACETFLPRAVLELGDGAMRPRTIALFARINQGDGNGSPNQTLPMDAPATPRTVSMVLELMEP